MGATQDRSIFAGSSDKDGVPGVGGRSTQCWGAEVCGDGGSGGGGGGVQQPAAP